MRKKLTLVLVSGLVLALLLAAAYGGWRLRKRAMVREGLVQGRAAFERGDWDTARRMLGRYLSAHPADVPVLEQYATAQLRMRPLPPECVLQALGAYRQILTAQPDNLAVFRRLCRLYEQTGNFGELEYIANKRLAAVPADPDARLAKAKALLFRERREDARTELEALVAATELEARVAATELDARVAATEPRASSTAPSSAVAQSPEKSSSPVAQATEKSPSGVAQSPDESSSVVPLGSDTSSSGVAQVPEKSPSGVAQASEKSPSGVAQAIRLCPSLDPLIEACGLLSSLERFSAASNAGDIALEWVTIAAIAAPDHPLARLQRARILRELAAAGPADLAAARRFGDLGLVAVAQDEVALAAALDDRCQRVVIAASADLSACACARRAGDCPFAARPVCLGRRPGAACDHLLSSLRSFITDSPPTPQGTVAPGTRRQSAMEALVVSSQGCP